MGHAPTSALLPAKTPIAVFIVVRAAAAEAEVDTAVLGAAMDAKSLLPAILTEERVIVDPSDAIVTVKLLVQAV